VTRIAPRSGATAPDDGFDGQMTLVEHLEELRSRLFKAALAIVLVGLVPVILLSRAIARVRPRIVQQRSPSDDGSALDRAV
jgi:Sec-independent protein secretion pathway component TatC